MGKRYPNNQIAIVAKDLLLFASGVLVNLVASSLDVIAPNRDSFSAHANGGARTRTTR